ncbi:MAG: hypothetical protein JXB48_15800 [Candidatus Latescibacteria bacterium]|nr:hypothetical protein [Candidatus Latescibacterota bacterium]
MVKTANKLILIITLLTGLILLTVGCSENGVVRNTINPENPSVTINDGVAYTTSQTVILSLSCEDDIKVGTMLLSNDAKFTGSEWEPYQTSKTWTLTDGFGIKTVYVRFADETNNLSDITQSTIEYIDAVTLKINPSTIGLNKGETTTVSVVAEDAVKLISAEITLSFDPAIVVVEDIHTSGTGFLFSDNGANVITAERHFDNNAGTLTIGVLGQNEGFTGATGTGYLATITFKGIKTGNTMIHFESGINENQKIYRYLENSDDYEDYPTLKYNGQITVN